MSRSRSRGGVCYTCIYIVLMIFSDQPENSLERNFLIWDGLQQFTIHTVIFCSDFVFFKCVRACVDACVCWCVRALTRACVCWHLMFALLFSYWDINENILISYVNYDSLHCVTILIDIVIHVVCFGHSQFTLPCIHFALSKISNWSPGFLLIRWMVKSVLFNIQETWNMDAI